MRLNPYLTFDGQCATAFKLYEKCLGGKITMMMTYGDSPMAQQAPPDWHQKIMHTTLALSNDVLQGADAFPGHYQKPQGFSVALNVNSVSEAECIFSALSENGTVQMDLQETFWAIRFGVLTDQFGTPWIINCERPV